MTSPRLERDFGVLELPVDFAAEAAQDVEDEPDDDEVHADVEDGRGAEREVTEKRHIALDVCRGENIRAEEERRGGRSRGENDARAEDLARVDRDSLGELEAAAREVARDEGEACEEAAGESPPGALCPTNSR